MSYDADAYNAAAKERALAASAIVYYVRHHLDRLPPDIASSVRRQFAEYDHAEAAMDRALGLPEVTP